jgi:hypothetical protein
MRDKLELANCDLKFILKQIMLSQIVIPILRNKKSI